METESKKLSYEKLVSSIPIVKALDHKTIYTNSSRTGISPWDIRITVGQNVENEKGEQVNQDQVTIVMTPSYAKQFLRNLEITVSKFVDAFGEINDPMAALNKEQIPKKDDSEKKKS